MKNEIGNKYNRLTVLKISHSDNGIFWLCKCDCGEKKAIKGNALRRGIIKSCGCLWKETIKDNFKKGRDEKSHGLPHGRKLKDLYRNMIRRCYDPKSEKYYCYGGRGISVCKKWRSDRRGFYKWAIENGYEPGLQINRKNNDGNYCPSNCNFVTATKNANNTRHNHMIEWNGKTQSIADWARELGCRGQALQHRFTRGWSLEKAMTQPFRVR